jgi:hypothetical protein
MVSKNCTCISGCWFVVIVVVRGGSKSKLLFRHCSTCLIKQRVSRISCNQNSHSDSGTSLTEASIFFIFHLCHGENQGCFPPFDGIAALNSGPQAC